MNREQFLREIGGRLKGLPRDDLERSLEYYNEMIADHIEDGARIGAEHLFWNGVHKLKEGAQELIGIEMLTHNKGHAAGVECHRAENVILI